MSAALSYDRDLRRDTPLARKLIARIRAGGPITVHDYMDTCLNDPEHGYYLTRTAIGRGGDFITAPEISQVFGELIGLWCAVVWQQMGSPKRFNLIELGAGRGTLMADALRAVRVVAGFREAVAVHILDQNPVLIEMQRKVLASSGVPVEWHATLDVLPSDAPSIWVANEFLDTVPVQQREAAAGRSNWRAVGLSANGQLAFVPPPPHFIFSGAANSPIDPLEVTEATIHEDQQFRTLSSAIRERTHNTPLAALFIDYGYVDTLPAGTLQAVRNHQYEHVLTSPGEADLSCHVNFLDFMNYFVYPHGREPLLTTHGPITQSEFLGQLGIMERASRLMAANPAKANALEMGVARLMAPQGMGTRFKAVGVRSISLPPLPGFKIDR